MKERLDNILVKKGFCETRSRARALILAGKVIVNGKMVDKAGSPVEEGADITLKESLPYVSRGGLKLEKALSKFNIRLDNKIVLDAGASTGGFTDCALQHGAKKVYAVDVGYGQLAWDLRNNPKVINMERTNIRYLTHDKIIDNPDLATVDVAFISLKHVFPVLHLLGVREVIALIKPQFEAGREKVGKKGVVRDSRVHEEVIAAVSHFAGEKEYYIHNLTYSPIKGPEGNMEYLGYFLKGEISDILKNLEEYIRSVVAGAHQEL